MISAIISRCIILTFGNLYPAYASYKAVRSKNVKEYCNWMQYWIVYAFFTCIENFTDFFLSWFPFYYEVKVLLVLWLLSPATKGSSLLYRKFVHPTLVKNEQDIDEYINAAKEKGYSAVLEYGTKGVNYATNVIMQTAIKAVNSTPLALQAPKNVPAIGRDQRDGVQLFNPEEAFIDEVEEGMDLSPVTYEDMAEGDLPPMDEIMISEDSGEEYVPGVRAKPKRSARIKELPKKRGKKEVAGTSEIVKKAPRRRKKKKSESEEEFSGMD